MKTCSTCGRSVRCGWSDSSPPNKNAKCLICWTAMIMTTFRYVKGKSDAREISLQTRRQARRREP